MKFALTLASLLVSQLALAQAWEVPKADANGDFKSGFVRGNRGFLAQTQWVVLDQDPRGLNCRSADGTVVGRFYTGQVIQARYLCDASSDAISTMNGSKWLLVSNSNDYTHEGPSMCFVRANIRYIAPVSEDDAPPARGSITIPSVELPSGC